MIRRTDVPCPYVPPVLIERNYIVLVVSAVVTVAKGLYRFLSGVKATVSAREAINHLIRNVKPLILFMLYRMHLSVNMLSAT